MTSRIKHNQSNAERCKKWRKSQGKDFKLQEAERKKQSRKNRTPAQIERDRSTAKDRMRRMREKRKADDQNTSHTNKENHVILTRHQTEKQRKNWREAKQRYRAKIGSQKKRRIKEKDKVYRQDRRQKTVKNVKSKYCPNDEDDCSESPTFTPEAKRKAVFRIRQRMPTDAKKYAVVLTGLMKTTPEKGRLLVKQYH